MWLRKIMEKEDYYRGWSLGFWEWNLGLISIVR